MYYTLHKKNVLCYTIHHFVAISQNII